MAENIRTGRISNIDYAKGMVQVVYKDRGDSSTTKMIPVLNYNGEYQMPQINDMVAVLHLSNGSSMGIVLGAFWSDANKPPASGKGVFYKRIGDGASVQYNPDSQEMILTAPHLKIQTNNGTQEF